MSLCLVRSIPPSIVLSVRVSIFVLPSITAVSDIDRVATTTNAVDATDPVVSAPTPPAKKLKTAAPEVTTNDVAPRSRRYRAVDNEVSDDPDA